MTDVFIPKRVLELVSDHRPVADGFAKAPIIEAIIDLTYGQDMSVEQTSAIKDALIPYYAKITSDPISELKIDVTTSAIAIKKDQFFHQLEGSDSTEIALVRPNGISVSKLAPYRCWNDLFDRFRRDTNAAMSAVGPIRVQRVATRFINRIDVPFDGKTADYEHYLEVQIKLPKSIGAIGPFQLAFNLVVPDQKANVVIQSAVVEPAVEGVASFILDIDVARTVDLPNNWDDTLDIINSFRGIKNFFYQQLLTAKALEDFA